MSSDSPAEGQGPHILAVGVDPETWAGIEDLFRHCRVTQVPNDTRRLLKPTQPLPSIVVAGVPPKATPMAELAQLLRMVYRNQPIFLLATDRSSFDRKFLVRSGFSEGFLLPVEKAALRTRLTEELAEHSPGKIKAYRPVKFLDVQPGTVLDFDTFLFLPLNNKFIQYATRGEPIDEERAKQLETHQMGTLYVRSTELQKFYHYALKAGGAAGVRLLGVTERKDLLKKAIRDLFSKVLVTEKEVTALEGAAYLAECAELIQSLVIAPVSKDLASPLMNWVGERYDLYSHCANVALYGALFSSALGIGEPLELALAGMLHDLGMASTAIPSFHHEESRMTADDLKLYRRHQVFGLNLLKIKKMELSTPVRKMIEQHHEQFSGLGFPRRLSGTQILPEAQLLSLIDRIDYLIGINDGEKQIGPLAAVKLLQTKKEFDPALLASVLELLPEV